MDDADVVREALTPSLDWTEEELAPALAALSRMEARIEDLTSALTDLTSDEMRFVAAAALAPSEPKETPDDD